MSTKDDLLQKVGEAIRHKNVEALSELAKEAEISGFFDINSYVFGLINQTQKNYSVAIDYFKKALEINPNNPVVLSRLGQNYLNTGQYEDSIRTYTEYLKNNGKKWIYYYQVGRAYKLSGKYKESMAAFLQAAEEKPDNLGVYYHISEVALKLKNIEIFKLYVTKVYEKFKDDGKRKEELGELLGEIALLSVENKEAELAVDCCNKLLAIEGTARAHLTTAIAYLFLKNFDEALKECSKVLELNPNSGMSYYLMADIYILKGERFKGIDLLKKAIEAEPVVIDMLKGDEDFKFLSIPKEATKEDIMKLIEKHCLTLSK